MKRIAGLVYLLAGLGSAGLCWMSLMMAVWGAPTVWMQPVGLLASLVLAAGGLGLLLGAGGAQRLCATGALGMAAFYVPALIEILPADSQHVAPAAVALEVAYFVILAGTFWFPRRLRWGSALVGATLGVAVAAASVTTVHRVMTGEYDRPVAYAFVGARMHAPLVSDSRMPGVPDPTTLHLLAAAGCGGQLRWTSQVGEAQRPSKLIVVACAPILAAKRLPYPKHGTVVYLWDGTTWRTLPKGAPCYAAGATLHVDGMLEEVSASGSHSSFAFLPDLFRLEQLFPPSKPQRLPGSGSDLSHRRRPAADKEERVITRVPSLPVRTDT